MTPRLGGPRLNPAATRFQHSRTGTREVAHLFRALVALAENTGVRFPVPT